MTAQEFLSQRKTSLIQVRLRHFLTTFLIGYLFYSVIILLFPLLKTKPPIIFMAVCMISTALFIGFSFKIAQIRAILFKRKYDKQKKDVISQAVMEARQKGNYKDLSLLLLDKDSHLFIIEAGFFICQHFEGSWFQENKLEYPDSWGKEFFSDLRLFFKKEKGLKYEDLNDWVVQATFLATVKKSVVEEIVNNF